MKNPESIAVFSIGATVILSFAYFFLLDSIRSAQQCKGRLSVRTAYLWRKAGGFFILGVIPGAAAMGLFGLSPQESGLFTGQSLSLWPWMLAAAVGFTGLNAINSRNAQIRSMYPEMRLSVWGAGDFGLAAGGWLLYLAGYEYLFRGLLLFSCHAAFGLWPAIAVNLALYAALHLPKGLKEATAAIPFGALLCYLAIESGSIWPAVLIHALQAITCEWFCLIRNPEMKFQPKNS